MKASSNIGNEVHCLFKGLAETVALTMGTNASTITREADISSEDVQTFDSLFIGEVVVGKKLTMAITIYAQSNTLVDNLDKIYHSNLPEEHVVDLYATQVFDGAEAPTTAKLYADAIMKVTNAGYGESGGIQIYEAELTISNSVPTDVPIAEIPITPVP